MIQLHIANHYVGSYAPQHYMYVLKQYDLPTSMK